MIAPVIPDKWRGYKATRVFRGVRYVISVKRGKGMKKGAAVKVSVDGKAIKGNIVPFPSPNTKEVKVEVVLV
jgi:cellobiose phosphorylase